MKTTRLLAAGIAALCTALAAGAAATHAQPESSKPAGTPTIGAVAFMAGQWRSRDEEGTTEEHWSKPEGNNVMGMFRWLKPDGTPAMFEILAITQEADGVYLRLRHFSAQLALTLEKDGPPMTLRLAESSAGKAVFKAVPTEKKLAAVTYTSPSPDTLKVLVEFPDPAREPLKFELKREPVGGQ